MSLLFKRAEHYRYLANEFRRLAANESSSDGRNYYLQMAGHYRTLAKAAELKTTLEAREPRLGLDNSGLTDGVLRIPHTVRSKDPWDVATRTPLSAPPWGHSLKKWSAIPCDPGDFRISR